VLATGLAMRFGALPLPEHLQSLQVLANPWVMGVAGFGAVMEFFADKVAWLDSAWDAIHGFVRPIGGALLALVPGAPSPSLPPELVLARFVAPILVDAGYDASLRDLRDNWAPVTSLAIFAVGLTTAAVALVVHMLVPAMPWAAAITFGAIVAPPDAVAATAVLRQLRPPQRILTVLEGESLLNDASALLIYRLAVGAVAANSFSLSEVAPTFLLTVVGSVVAGPALGWTILRLTERVQHVPTPSSFSSSARSASGCLPNTSGSPAC
jgi:NhaP-type Na+/H+ or K+/H+ antiporter